jgi:hypothetical protein
MNGGSANPMRWLRQVFRDNWPTAEATVDSCTWVYESDHPGAGHHGHYDVTLSYKPANSNLAGLDAPHHVRFCRSGSRHITPYCAGEQISIFYNPKNPNRFRLADSPPDHQKLEAIVILALFALMAGYLLFAF